MARKKSYRKYRHKSQKGPNFIEALFALVALVWLWFHFYIKPHFERHKDEITNWFTIAIYLLIGILVVLLSFWIYKKVKSTSLSARDGRDAVFDALVNEMNAFSQIRNHSSEALYQMELAGFLKKTFPRLDIEETRSDTRPDIVVWNIAIEVKWPTWKAELRTIADKIIRYLKQYDKLVVILFDLQISNKEYQDWEDWIFEAFSNKAGSLEIIVK